MPQTSLDMLRFKLHLLENRRVRFKTDQRAIRFRCLALLFAFQFPLLEKRLHELSFAVAFDQKFLRERIYRLRADAVQSHAELKDVIIVLCPGIDLRNAIHHLPQWDSASKISNRD